VTEGQVNLFNRYGFEGQAVLEECGGGKKVDIGARNSVTYLRQNVIVVCRLGT
jgi:hypothetical protein